MVKDVRKRNVRGIVPPKLVAKGFQISSDDIENAYRVTDNAVEKLHNCGIVLPERPTISDSRFINDDGFPVTPSNLMDLDNNELGELYSIVDAWKTYIAGQVAEATVRHEEILKQAELVSAKVRLQKSGLKQADKTAAVITDTRYISAQQEVMESTAFLTLLKNAETNMETKRKTISRIISLRDQEVRSGSRLNGIGARRTFSDHMPEKDEPPLPRTNVQTRPSIKRRRKREQYE
ncbi:MAG: hypothetical protein ACFFFC_00105 [Candidatus Thorarchaeota archaeon]